MAVKFRLGEQPDWANTEPAEAPSASFVSSVLGDPVTSLINRGYCVVPLAPDTQDLYSHFHKAFELFSAQSTQQKSEFACVQFDVAKHTPNQYHGFSAVSGLKEQFMMRVGGNNSNLPFPDIGDDFGKQGTSLYIALDQLCRHLTRGVLRRLNLSEEILQRILDPVGFPEVWQPARSKACVSTGYVPENYVSSSIMDNFHYQSWHGKDTHEQHKRFVNNHAAHTDSGLLTVVVCTDEPALEVFDNQLQRWIALEQCLHMFVKAQDKGALAHRKYATVFWGDSCDYLGSTALKACLHRVEKADGERYSVVFKQRTSPLGTAPRYQEDYELGRCQVDSLQQLRASRRQWRLVLLALGALLFTRRVMSSH